MVSMDTEDITLSQQQQQQDEGGLVHRETNTTLYYGERNRGKGVLDIRESDVLWKGTEQANNTDTLTLKYPSISLHAISRDTNNFPHRECLFMLLECPAEMTEDDDGAAAEDGANLVQDPEGDVREIRFVPDNEDNIKAMYDAVTECQELHPDPDDENAGDFEDDGYDDTDDMGVGMGSGQVPDFDTLLMGGEFYTADNMPDEIELSEEGRAVLQRLNIVSTATEGDVRLLGNNGNLRNGNHGNGNGNHEDQFEDAEEDMDAS